MATPANSDNAETIEQQKKALHERLDKDYNKITQSTANKLHEFIQAIGKSEFYDDLEKTEKLRREAVQALRSDNSYLRNRSISEIIETTVDEIYNYQTHKDQHEKQRILDATRVKLSALALLGDQVKFNNLLSNALVQQHTLKDNKSFTPQAKDLLQPSSDYISPLQAAAFEGLTGALKNAKDKINKDDNPQSFMKLLKQPDITGSTPLKAALKKHGNTETAKYIVDQYSEEALSTPESFKIYFPGKDGGETTSKTSKALPIHLAAQYGHVDVFNHIANKNPKNTQKQLTATVGGKSIFYYAARNKPDGHKIISSDLVRNNLTQSQINSLMSKSTGGINPVYVAVHFENTQAIQAIVKHYPAQLQNALKEKNSFNQTPIQKAAVEGKSQLLSMLYAVSTEDKNQLISDLRKNRKKLANNNEHTTEIDASIDQLDNTIAKENSARQAEYGAVADPPNQREDRGRTPIDGSKAEITEQLHTAARLGKTDTINQISNTTRTTLGVSRTAYIKLKDNNDQSILHHAANNKSNPEQTIAAIKQALDSKSEASKPTLTDKRRVETNANQQFNDNVLHTAVAHNNYKAIRAFAKHFPKQFHQAAYQDKNTYDQTPIQQAFIEGHSETLLTFYLLAEPGKKADIMSQANDMLHSIDNALENNKRLTDEDKNSLRSERANIQNNMGLLYTIQNYNLDEENPTILLAKSHLDTLRENNISDKLNQNPQTDISQVVKETLHGPETEPKDDSTLNFQPIPASGELDIEQHIRNIHSANKKLQQANKQPLCDQIEFVDSGSTPTSQFINDLSSDDDQNLEEDLAYSRNFNDVSQLKYYQNKQHIATHEITQPSQRNTPATHNVKVNRAEDNTSTFNRVLSMVDMYKYQAKSITIEASMDQQLTDDEKQAFISSIKARASDKQQNITDNFADRQLTYAHVILFEAQLVDDDDHKADDLPEIRRTQASQQKQDKQLDSNITQAVQHINNGTDLQQSEKEKNVELSLDKNTSEEPPSSDYEEDHHQQQFTG